MRMIVGVDLGGTSIVVGTVSEDGHALHGHVQESTPVHLGPDGVVERIIAMIQQSIEHTRRETGDRDLEVAGVGIGAPGPLDTAKGIVIVAPNLGWHDMPLRERIAGVTGFDARLDNDANCATLGEWWRGAAAGARFVVGFTIGTGIGGGIVLDGRVFHGASDVAGEFGHMTIDVTGRRCKCGNYGCLEAYASGTAIAARTIEELRADTPSSILSLVDGDLEQVTAQIVYQAARDGDALAHEIVRDTALALPPLNRLLARELMSRTRVYELLRGYRDTPPANLDAIADGRIADHAVRSDVYGITEFDTALDDAIDIDVAIAPGNQLAAQIEARGIAQRHARDDGEAFQALVELVESHRIHAQVRVRVLEIVPREVRQRPLVEIRIEAERLLDDGCNGDVSHAPLPLEEFHRDDRSGPRAEYARKARAEDDPARRQCDHTPVDVDDAALVPRHRTAAASGADIARPIRDEDVEILGRADAIDDLDARTVVELLPEGGRKRLRCGDRDAQ